LFLENLANDGGLNPPNGGSRLGQKIDRFLGLNLRKSNSNGAKVAPITAVYGR
jgi:hypothetical protein